MVGLEDVSGNESRSDVEGDCILLSELMLAVCQVYLFKAKHEAFMTHLELYVRLWVTILELDVVFIALAELRFCLPQPIAEQGGQGTI